MKAVVKVQPVVVRKEGKSGEREILIYTKDRKFHTIQKLTSDMIIKLAARPAAYFEAEIKGQAVKLGPEKEGETW